MIDKFPCVYPFVLYKLVNTALSTVQTLEKKDVWTKP